MYLASPRQMYGRDLSKDLGIIKTDLQKPSNVYEDCGAMVDMIILCVCVFSTKFNLLVCI